YRSRRIPRTQIPSHNPKNRVLTPQKRGYIYIFIYFYLMVTNGHTGHQKHHPTHLLSPHKYFLYALSEQQRLLVLLAFTRTGLAYSPLWIPCWVLQICCAHIGDHIGGRRRDRAVLLLTSMKYPVRSLQESKLARESRIWYNGGMDNNRVLNANVAERIGLTISGV